MLLVGMPGHAAKQDVLQLKMHARFVSLCTQAAYHGVPLVTMPGHVLDQADNAVRAARLGFSIPIYLGRNFSEGALRASLMRVLTEPGFRRAARRVAARMHARRRSPAEEAVGAQQPDITRVRSDGVCPEHSMKGKCRACMSYAR